MSDQFWLTETQLKHIDPLLPKVAGVPRVDDHRVVSGIIHVIRNGLAMAGWPHKTLYTVRSLVPHASSTASSPTLRLRAGRRTG